MIIKAMVQRAREMLIFMFLASFLKTSGGVGVEVGKPNFWHREIIPPPQAQQAAENAAYCLSWRLGVEANNVRWWRTVPGRCLWYVETYMIGGQYERDVGLIVDQITSYAVEITVYNDGLDAWIFDVDDTCISNVFYYRGKRYGCDPYDPSGFKAWAMIGGCPAVPGMLELFKKLVELRFKVFLVTGRDEETLGQPTIDNLHNQGFQDYERLIMRSAAYKGLSAVIYKSEIRKQLMKQGYRIWGNVGDQWSDLQGECLGNRTFKLPNPMCDPYDPSGFKAWAMIRGCPAVLGMVGLFNKLVESRDSKYFWSEVETKRLFANPPLIICTARDFRIMNTPL